MSTIQISTPKTKSKCPVCLTEGLASIREKLPKSGILMQSVHDNGEVHVWSEYGSLRQVEKANTRKSRDPKIIICPECRHRGRINYFRADPTKPEVTYVVTHEALKGTWGKDKNVKKRRRCYIRDPAKHVAILKKLGLLPTEPAIKKEGADKLPPSRTVKIVDCPKCGNKGRLYSFPDRAKGVTRFRVDHIKRVRCYLNKDDAGKL